MDGEEEDTELQGQSLFVLEVWRPNYVTKPIHFEDRYTVSQNLFHMPLILFLIVNSNV